MPLGPVPTVMGDPGRRVAMSTGVTVVEPVSVTQSVFPSGVIAIAVGSGPALMPGPTRLVARSTGTTSACCDDVPELETNAVFPSGVTATRVVPGATPRVVTALVTRLIRPMFGPLVAVTSRRPSGVTRVPAFPLVAIGVPTAFVATSTGVTAVPATHAVFPSGVMPTPPTKPGKVIGDAGAFVAVLNGEIEPPPWFTT